MQKLLVAGLLVAVLAVLGCGKGSDSTVLAKIGRTKITVGDFNKQVDALPPQMQQAITLLHRTPRPARIFSTT
jgi:hypothetical protein